MQQEYVAILFELLFVYRSAEAFLKTNTVPIYTSIRHPQITRPTLPDVYTMP